LDPPKRPTCLPPYVGRYEHPEEDNARGRLAEIYPFDGYWGQSTTTAGDKALATRNRVQQAAPVRILVCGSYSVEHKLQDGGNMKTGDYSCLDRTSVKRASRTPHKKAGAGAARCSGTRQGLQQVK